MPRVAVQRREPFGKGAASLAPENDPGAHQDGGDDENHDEGAFTHGAETNERSLNGP